MKKEIDRLINEGYSVEEILEGLKQFRSDQQIRCDKCDSRLADFENGIVIIKCRCGKYTEII